MKRIFYSAFFVFILFGYVSAQEIVKSENEYCISDKEYKLYNAINEYRISKGLSDIPLSKSLCYVAYLHTMDLNENWSKDSQCNMHSWSGKIGGSAFCYPADQDVRKRRSVWNKAKDITGFPAVAYELIYKDDFENADINIALDMWKTSVAGRDYLLNEEKWKDSQWNSIGIGICKNYVSVWLSVGKDPKGAPTLCSADQSKKTETAAVTKENEGVEKSVTGSLTGNEGFYDQVPGKFYIIGSSTDSPEKAIKDLALFKSKGYSNAKILKMQNKYRVAMMECNSQQEANEAKLKCASLVKDCWILK